MPKAIWNGTVLAESDKTIVVEGNHYFPPESINRHYFHSSETHTVCPWKGTANYYDIEVNGQVNRGAAWYYPEPKPVAKNIKGYVAFWRGVKVESDQEKVRPGLLKEHDLKQIDKDYLGALPPDKLVEVSVKSLDVEREIW